MQKPKPLLYITKEFFTISKLKMTENMKASPSEILLFPMIFEDIASFSMFKFHDA
jgi:hypothetical protein